MMAQSEYRQTASSRIQDSLMSDYLTLELFAYVGIDPFDALLRPSASWTVEDGVILKAGADIFLGDSSGQYGQYRDNTLVCFAQLVFLTDERARSGAQTTY